MSSETQEWLENNIMVGNGVTPWWAKDELSNLYDGPLDRQEIRSKLLAWVPNVKQIYDEDMNPIEGFIRLVPSDDSKATLGIHTEDYRVHEYGELLDISELPVASAGLLKARRIFWVTFSQDDTGVVSTPEGVDFLPYITGVSSLDGSMSTGVFEHYTLPVCDNTLQIGRMEGERIKIKHSKNSGVKWMGDAKKAADRLAQMTNEMSTEISTLCGLSVTDRQWDAFLNEWCPLPQKQTTKGGGPGKAYSMAENRRTFMDEMYRTDQRVAPWTGTAFGVLQAVNTYANHNAIVRDTEGIGATSTRVQSNMMRTIRGNWAEVDKSTLETLDRVLVSA